MTKQFKLRKEDLEPLATDHGGCTATDGIVVDGRLVGVMIRDATERPNDSGWRFEGAGEDPRMLEDPASRTSMPLWVRCVFATPTGRSRSCRMRSAKGFLAQ